MKKRTSHAILLCLGLLVPAAQNAFAQPEHVSYQGQLLDNGMPYTGTADFKFVIHDGAQTLWSNDGTSVGMSQPSGSVLLSVDGGIFSVLLGAAPMTPLTTDALKASTDVMLRVWVDTGGGAFEQLTDQPLSSAAFALHSESAERALSGFVGTSADDAIVGVSGINTANGVGTAGTGAGGPGVFGTSVSHSGVVGQNNNNQPTVVGINGGAGVSVAGISAGTGSALTGAATSGHLLDLVTWPGLEARLSVDNAGNLTTVGTLNHKTLVDFHGESATTAIQSTPTQYDDAQVTLTVPGPGYVVVTSNVQVRLSHTMGTTDRLLVGHSDDALSLGASTKQHVFDIPSAYPSSSDTRHSFALATTHGVTAPGTYTFYLVGEMASGQSAGDDFWFASTTAIFYPEPDAVSLFAAEGEKDKEY